MLEIEKIIKNDVNVKKSLEILECEKCNLLKQTRLRQNFLLLHALLLLLLPSFRKAKSSKPHNVVKIVKKISHKERIVIFMHGSSLSPKRFSSSQSAQNRE